MTPLPQAFPAHNPPQFTEWQWPSDSPSSFPRLALDEIHIWRSPLDTSPTILGQLHGYLSEDEQTRAARFHFEIHRHHYTVGRGLLRVLLGQYVQREPQTLAFEYSDRGKPFLADPRSNGQGFLGILESGARKNIQFNVSHSGGLVLYAIALNRRVGIDVEEIRPMENAAQLVQRFFTQREYDQLLAHPLDQQELAFFRGWTRKEAYLKATGEGIGGLETVEVSLLEEQPTVLKALASSGDVPIDSRKHKPNACDSTSQWNIYDISLDTTHRAAVVYESEQEHLLSMRFFQPVFLVPH